VANSQYTASFRDYDGEPSSFRVNSALLTSGNIVAQTAAASALLTALAGITIGIIAKNQLIAYNTTLSSVLPTNPIAQRESKWLVLSQDNVTHKLFRNEIPTADLTLLTNHSEFITDFTPAALAAFKTAWEAFVLSEDGNACTLISLQAVGKRL